MIPVASKHITSRQDVHTFRQMASSEELGENEKKNGNLNLRRCSEVKVTRRLRNHTRSAMRREERASRLSQGQHQLVRGRSAPVELFTR